MPVPEEEGGKEHEGGGEGGGSEFLAVGVGRRKKGRRASSKLIQLHFIMQKIFLLVTTQRIRLFDSCVPFLLLSLSLPASLTRRPAVRFDYPVLPKGVQTIRIAR